MPWIWEVPTTRYRDQDTGRFLSAADVRDLAEERVRITGAGTDGLASMLTGDQLGVRDWETLMREAIKDQYIQEYILGRGGLSQMTPEDWGSIGGMLAEQYKFLSPFATEIADTNLTEAQIAARSRMYIHSSREALSRATARANGWPVLPDHPASGRTICLCITTPESRVLTSTGWRPIGEIQAGDVVFTHRGRWRSVLHPVIKPSRLGQRQVWMQGPTDQPVGCTASHRWLTSQGWMSAIGIDNLQLSVYHLPQEVVHGETVLQRVRDRTGEQKQAEPVHEMRQASFGLPLREKEGLSGSGMPLVWNEQDSKGSVGQEQTGASGCGARGSQETAHPLRAPEGGDRWRIIQGCPAPPPVQDVWPLLSQAPPKEQAKQLLFGSVLPTGTALYDIVVEEDHSYIIEGLVSHNTNCACNWSAVQLPDGTWEFTWNLDFAAEHCTSDEVDAEGRPRGCVERAALWNPLVIQ